MSLLQIRKYPDQVLKQTAAPFANIDGRVQDLIDDMVETMYAAPGIGLAAPQVGVSGRLIVVDISNSDAKHRLFTLINPEIAESEGIIECEEGCLSVPQYTALVKRAESVLLKALDRNGRPVEIEATGLLARAFQHEIDHLNGVLFVDRLSLIKREFFKKRYQKLALAGR